MTPGDTPEKAFCERADAAKKTFQDIAQHVSDCYEFCLPMRERPYPDGGPVSRRTDRLFDTTAGQALQAHASRTVEFVWPTNQQPFELLPGTDASQEDRKDEQLRLALAEVREDIIATVNHSNFGNEAYEASLDYAISTGILLVEPGDFADPLKCRALPLGQAFIANGPNGVADRLYYPCKRKLREISVLWPQAELPDSLSMRRKDKPDDEVEVVEGWERDWSVRGTETWRYTAVLKDGQDTVKLGEGVESGFGSKPFVDFSFMRVASETYGRGPAMIALPDILTLNLLKQYTLEYANLAINGMYNYEDAGVVNVDNIQVAPGAIIPVMPGTKGLQPVPMAGDPRLGQLEIEMLQGSIQSAFFDLDLGPVDQTPKSATEIMARTNENARKQSGPHNRLITQFLVPFVRRVAHIRRKQGAIRLPAIDGRQIAIKPLTPITRMQQQDDILRHVNWAQTTRGVVGPEAFALVANQERLAKLFGDWFGVDPKSLNTSLERDQLVKAIAAGLAAQAQAGAAPQGAA